MRRAEGPELEKTTGLRLATGPAPRMTVKIPDRGCCAGARGNRQARIILLQAVAVVMPGCCIRNLPAPNHRETK